MCVHIDMKCMCTCTRNVFTHVHFRLTRWEWRYHDGNRNLCRCQQRWRSIFKVNIYNFLNFFFDIFVVSWYLLFLHSKKFVLIILVTLFVYIKQVKLKQIARNNENYVSIITFLIEELMRKKCKISTIKLLNGWFSHSFAKKNQN